MRPPILRKHLSDPPRRVTWGLESTDEMGAITFVATAARAEDTDALRAAVREKFSEARRGGRRPRIDWYDRVMRLDTNDDGRISADEVPEIYRRGLERIDRNGDGELDAAELALLKELSRQGEGGDGGEAASEGGDGR